MVYYCYGTCLSVFPSTVADFFGTKNLGINYGWVFTAWGVAGIVGPIIAGYMFRAYQSYTGAFYTAGILAVISLICHDAGQAARAGHRQGHGVAQVVPRNKNGEVGSLRNGPASPFVLVGVRQSFSLAGGWPVE